MLVDTSRANKGGDENGEGTSRTLIWTLHRRLSAAEDDGTEKQRRKMLSGTLNLVNRLKIGVVFPVKPDLETTWSGRRVQILHPRYHRPTQMARAVGANCQRPSQKLTLALIQINLVTNYR